MYAMVDLMPFSEWLENQLKINGITQSELARRAEVTRSAINGILTGARGPGVDLCQAIARAFKLPPEQVYRVAGLLPQEPNSDPLTKAAIHLLHDLPEEDKQEVYEYIRLKLRLAEERQEYNTKRRSSRKPAAAKSS